jgi:sigma-B regulation protein RsbU (phosphoserine phosphatase)
MNSLAENSPVLSNVAPARVLVADDQPDVIEALRLLLQANGYQVVTATSPAAVLDAVRGGPFDLLIDLNYARDTTSGREGLDLLAELQRNIDLPPVVVMTGWATVALAVEAMHRGIVDFVEKPWDNNRLLETLSAQIARHRARREAADRAAALESHTREIETELRNRALEIEEAHLVQRGFLPREIPRIPGFEIAAAWRPARGVGGDSFDVLKLDDANVVLSVSDVAGKGVPAALLMSNLQAMVRGRSSPGTRPRDFCTEATIRRCWFTPTARGHASTPAAACSGSTPAPDSQTRKSRSLPVIACCYSPTALPNPLGPPERNSARAACWSSPSSIAICPPRPCTGTCSMRC